MFGDLLMCYDVLILDLASICEADGLRCPCTPFAAVRNLKTAL